jgi:hypothetical protein
MRVKVRHIAVLAVAVAGAAPAVTSASSGPTPVVPHSCPHWHAQVTQGSVGTIVYDPQTGKEVSATPVAGGGLSFITPYKAIDDAKIQYQGNTYAVRAGAEFALSCYGQSISRPNDLNGALYLHSGQMSVDTTSQRPGGIKTFEALLNPVGATAQHIAVNRETKNDVTGSTHMTAGGPIVDVTPEQGKNAGHCIYHHDVKLTSTFDRRAQNFRLDVTVIS